MAEPYRVLFSFDYEAGGIWWVSPKEETEAASSEEWRRVREALYGPSGQPPFWRLSAELLADLKAWNNAHDYAYVPDGEAVLSGEVLEEQGRDLAIRVQNELGTEGWEVLYYLGGRMHRVHPPGSWPAESWKQDLLGYAPRDPRADR
ncbi:MAG: hypothetical protein ACM3ML_16795 [Micromonosporaceae bacterium]